MVIPRKTSSETMRDACPGFVPCESDVPGALLEEFADEFPDEVLLELSDELSNTMALRISGPAAH